MDELDEILQLVEKLFNKSHAILGLIAIFPQTSSILNNPFHGEKSEIPFSLFIKKYCIEHQIDHFYVCSEAWASPSITPSKDPNRKEIIAVTLVTKTGSTVVVAPIIGLESPARFLGNWKNHTRGIAHTRWDVCLNHN